MAETISVCLQGFMAKYLQLFIFAKVFVEK